MDTNHDDQLIEALSADAARLKERAEERARELDETARQLRQEARDLRDESTRKELEAKQTEEAAERIRSAAVPAIPADRRAKCRNEFHGAGRNSTVSSSGHIRRQSCGCWECSACGDNGDCDIHAWRI
jgi:hypothetical protein